MKIQRMINSLLIVSSLSFAMVSGMSHASQEEDFHARDLNGDGVIDLSEHRADEEATFAAMDTNADGEITVGEYADYLVRDMDFPADVALSLAKCFVRHVDSDGNGTLSREEMIAFNDRIFFALAGDDELLTLEESLETPPPDALPPMAC